MTAEIALRPRHPLWWIYAVYWVGAFAVWTYWAFTRAPWWGLISYVSVAFEVVGLFCFYCFLRQKATISRYFWIGFVLLYFAKLAVGLGFLLDTAVRFPWDGSHENLVTLMALLGVLLGIPAFIAFSKYAFGSRQMWATFRRGSQAQPGVAPMRTRTAFVGVIAALVMGAFVVVVLFPDKVVGSLPAWLPGGPQVVLEVEPEGVDLQQAVEESIRIIDRRLVDLGTRVSARQQGPARIVVRLSPLADAKRSIEVATRRGRLEFRLIDTTMTAEQAIRGQPPAGSEVLYERGGKKPHLVAKQVLVSGRDLVEAQAGFSQLLSFLPIITFRFNAAGTSRFAEVTQENVGRPFAIVFDSEVLSAPVIRMPILEGSVQISGGFVTTEQANELAILLRAGELPGRLVVIEERMTGL